MQNNTKMDGNYCKFQFQDLMMGFDERFLLSNIMKHLLIAIIFTVAFAYQDILRFGAIPNEDTLVAQKANQAAILQALKRALSSQSQGDNRTVLIPQKKFYTLPIAIQNANDLVIEVRGKLVACNRIKHWPKAKKQGNGGMQYDDFISIAHSKNIVIRGGGKIDGRGYIWWLNSWLVTKKYLPANSRRPHLITTDFVTNITIHDLVLKNSPCYHLKNDQTIDAKFYNLDIKVNTTAQLDIIKRNYLNGIIPMFPLNTDGIDPQGRNFHIFNITCQNYDDVVVPKPSHRSPNFITNCTENMLIENITVRLGVGLSIGSVPPNTQINCVRNITFRNAFFEKPFKGIYIKTNPGKNGFGIIDNILYENITMHQPIWWAIYLGPQQQKQPDRGGPGCMLYPFDPKGTCQTQPRINITNIKLKNVLVRSSLLFPIVMRCNETNPCVNVTFENVQAKGWLIGKKNKGYVCQHVYGTQKNSSPKLDCLKSVAEQSNNLLSEQTQDTQLFGSYEQLLSKMQAASKEIGYIEQDDEMNLTDEEIRQDTSIFSQENQTVI